MTGEVVQPTTEVWVGKGRHMVGIESLIVRGEMW